MEYRDLFDDPSIVRLKSERYLRSPQINADRCPYLQDEANIPMLPNAVAFISITEFNYSI